MRDRREHEILVCFLAETHHQSSFNEIATRSEWALDRKTLVADTPPPKRDIALTIIVSDQIGLTARSLERTFGFAFEEAILVDGNSIRMSFVRMLEGLITRIVRDNNLITFYGINVIIFVENLPEETCVALYSYFMDWCRRFENEIQCSVTFDIVCSDAEFNYIIANEHRRMVHGDIKAQYAAAQTVFR
jgi:hypothetical protein